ncbi:MAG: FecR domain-containing protein [Byssovorax sp.]
MSTATCERLWQVEASADGRLGPADAASFERHLATCAICAAERDALLRLTEIVGAPPEPPLAQLAQRRARNALIKAADATLRARPRIPRIPRLRAAALGLALAAALPGLWLALRPAPRPSAAATTRFEVHDEGHARFVEDADAGPGRVILLDGRASFTAREPSADRLIVVLPDGTIEGRGARFTVEVRRGRTHEVVVFEGSISIAVGGYQATLDAQDHWIEPDPPSTSAPEASTASPAPSAPEKPEPPRNGAIAPKEPGSSAPSASSARAPSPAGGRFAEAMSAFSSSEYARAERLFQDFVRDFPRDGRAEDATYLQIECRARRGDQAGAAAAARQYLLAFPRGLRRPEAARIAGVAP